MRRLARRLFTLCSAVSLVVCVVAVQQWLAGHVYINGASGPTVQWRLVSNRGSLVVECHHFPHPVLGNWRGPVWQRGGWGFSTGATRVAKPKRLPLSGMIYVRWWGIPWWSVALTSAVMPGLWFRRLARRVREHARTESGLCPACGYDLRASPERCPECGAAAQQG